MILSKLYCSDSRFKTIEFNEGFNLILAKINKKHDGDTHGLGKTTTAKLINFMLLKKMDRSFFLKIHEKKFENHIFFLEIKLNNGKYLTIKRGVKNNTKISFKISQDAKQNLSNSGDWDEDNFSYEKAKKKLNEYLNFDILKTYNYRKFLKYIIRTQDNFIDVFERTPGKDIDWKAPLLNLFDLENDDYKNKIEKEEKVKQLKSNFSNIGDDYIADLDEKKQYLTILETDIIELKDKIDKFDYYQIDSEITDEIADNIYSKITDLNRERYILQVDINNIQKRIDKNTPQIDLETLEILYKEVNIYFSDSIKKDYDQLLEFNKKISTEREELLLKSLGKKQETLKKVDKQLKELNTRQSKVLEILSRNNKVKKIIDHQKEFNNLEINKTKLETEIQFLEEGKEQLKEVDKINVKIAELKVDIRTNLENKSEIQKKISTLLSDLSNKVFSDLIAFLTIAPNGNGNPDFIMKLMNKKTNKSTSEDDGNHKNIFMISIFDIALLSTYSSHSFYKFLFHDGNIEASDHRLKESYLKTVKEYCNKYNLQYITTAIEDEIKDVKDIIEEKDIILKLTDNKNHSGTLFGFNY